MTHTIETPVVRKAARKPRSLVGMEPAAHIDSYDSVPWYRKQWFALFPPFVVALIVIASTGPVYAKANKTMKRYSDANVWYYTPVARTYLVATALVVIAFISFSIWG